MRLTNTGGKIAALIGYLSPAICGRSFIICARSCQFLYNPRYTTPRDNATTLDNTTTRDKQHQSTLPHSRAMTFRVAAMGPRRGGGHQAHQGSVRCGDQHFRHGECACLPLHLVLHCPIPRIPPTMRERDANARISGLQQRSLGSHPRQGHQAAQPPARRDCGDDEGALDARGGYMRPSLGTVKVGEPCDEPTSEPRQRFGRLKRGGSSAEAQVRRLKGSRKAHLQRRAFLGEPQPLSLRCRFFASRIPSSCGDWMRLTNGTLSAPRRAAVSLRLSLAREHETL